MARTDKYTFKRQTPGLERKIFWARLMLAWEILWPTLWPAVGIAGLFLALSLFDVLPALPNWLHTLILIGFVLLLVRAVFLAIHRFEIPDKYKGQRRLERDNGLEHRPLTAVTDTLAGGASEPISGQIWQIHKQRMTNLTQGLKVRLPSTGLARSDPFALRISLGLLLVVAITAGRSEPLERLVRAVMPAIHQKADAPPIVMDLWITPPDYTGLPPIFPLRIAKQEEASIAATLPLHPSRSERKGSNKTTHPADSAAMPTLVVPSGSMLTAQIQGATEPPKLSLDEEQTTFEQVEPDYSKIVKSITSDGHLSVIADEIRLGEWHITVLQDQKPAIAFSNPPLETPQATLKLSYTASDDYGITKGYVEFRRTYEHGTVIGKQIDRIELPLPSRASRAVDETSVFDLAPHRWAGQPVIIKLVSFDALKQQGNSEQIKMVLPERVFTHPVARSIIRLRKQFAAHPERRNSVLHGLAELSAAPDEFNQDSVVYLALTTARLRLTYDRTDKAVDPVLSLLWNTALRLEDGKLSIAEWELRQVQQALMKALAVGASDPELDRLLKKLHEAVARYMAALQEQMRRNPNAQQQALEFDPRTMRLIQGGDVERMLHQIRKLMQSGARQAAREMLARLQRLLEGMRSMQVMRMRGSRGVEDDGPLRQLQELIRRQQQLLEQTFRFSMPGSQPKGQMPGAADQRALQQLLRRLQSLLSNGRPGQKLSQALDQANRAMERAIRALRGKRPGVAVSEQGNALEKLRHAGRRILQQMMDRFARRSGNRTNRSNQGDMPRRDPLGRETMGDDIDTKGVIIPDASSIQRARKILDELRRRSGQNYRQKLELEYINRLLMRF